MADMADTANVLVRPPIAWGLAILAGLLLDWIEPMPFMPTDAQAVWLGAIIFALALALAFWAITGLARTCRPAGRPRRSWRAARTACRATRSTSAWRWR